MFVPLKQPLEKWTRGCQDHPVSVHLLTILTHQGDIREVLVFSQIPKGNFDIFLEVVPLETQLLWHCFWSTANLWIGLDRWQLWNTTHQYIHKFWIQSWRKHDKLSYPWRERKYHSERSVTLKERESESDICENETIISLVVWLAVWSVETWGQISVTRHWYSPTLQQQIILSKWLLIQHFILWSVFRWPPFFFYNDLFPNKR